MELPSHNVFILVPNMEMPFFPILEIANVNPLHSPLLFFFLLFQLWRQIIRKRCNIPWRDPFSAILPPFSFLSPKKKKKKNVFYLLFLLDLTYILKFWWWWLFLPRVGGGVRRCIITPFTSFYFSQVRRQHVHINRRPNRAVVKKKTPMTSRSESLGLRRVEVGDETHDIPWSWQGRQLPRRFLSFSDSFQKTFVIRVMSAKLTLFLCLLATRGPSPSKEKHVANHGCWCLETIWMFQLS